MKPRHVAIVVAVVAALGGAVWLLSFRSDPSRELKAAAAAFLTRLGDGRVDQAYSQSADELKSTIDLRLFSLAVDDLNGAVGRFRRLARVTRSTIAADPATQATRADFAAEVEFEKRSLPIELGFVHGTDGWRVTRFKVDYPDGFWPEPDAEALTRDSAQVMAWFAAGELTALYARLYPDVWDTWKPSKFEADVQGIRGACGRFEIGAPRVIGTNAGKMTLVESAVACERGSGFVTQLKWSWRHGKWRLLGMAWVPVEKAVGSAAP